MDHMFPQSQPQQFWHCDNQMSTLDIPTAPSSPTFLPIQGGIETSPLTLDTQTLPSKEEDGEELVGMGLYDSPADVQSSSLLFGGGFGGIQRKRSLKLEESFEPVADSIESAEGGEVEEDAEGNESEPETDSKLTQFLIHQDPSPLPTSTLVGQTFFFDSEHDLPTTSNADMTYMGMNGYQPQYFACGWI